MYRVLLYVAEEIAFAWWSIYGHICDLLHSHLVHGCPLGTAGGRTGGKYEIVQPKPKNKDKIFPSPATPNLSKRVCGHRGHETIVAKIYILQVSLSLVYSFPCLFCYKATTMTIRVSGSQGADKWLERWNFLKIYFSLATLILLGVLLSPNSTCHTFLFFFFWSLFIIFCSISCFYRQQPSHAWSPLWYEIQYFRFPVKTVIKLNTMLRY